jgi:cytochrome c
MSTASRTRSAGCHATVLATALLAGCLPAGSEERGRLLLEQYDCGKCHVIPGVRRAQGMLGPALHDQSRNAYLAGEIPNQPELLIRWIQHPSALVPDTLMPDQGVPESHARDMSAYLMSLR